MKHILYIIFFLYTSISFSQLTGRVIKIKDGDTIVILDSSFKQHTIRIADIDCPEKNQPFGKKAKWFVSDEIYLSSVKVKEKGKDRYGRIIGYVLYKNKNLSEELLKNGLAWHYKKYSKSKSFQSLEDRAKKNRVGLWQDNKAVAPWKWRKKRR